MSLQDIRLSDRYDLDRETVLLNGTQALVRLTLMQAARDRAAGLNTGGYVTGYRGSPLGAVDQQMGRNLDLLREAGVIFEPGLNEDLAATALWGTQQAELRGEGSRDGVFGMWYGKGPGVDRSGDVMKHANLAGTSPHGGVLFVMGDDHTGESSTTCHQSEFALLDAYMPVLSPAGVQEILDYGLFGWALSRYAGVWVGLKAMKDTVEATAVVDGRADRMRFVTPDYAMPEGGLNIRLVDHWTPQEERLIAHKRYAAEAFGHANGIDKRMLGKPGAKIGFLAAGKNWLDLAHALDLLGIDGARAEALGITAYKVGMTWPLDVKGFLGWAEGLDVIVVVEEKRKLLEVQVKEAIFNDRRGRRVYGGQKAPGEVLFPAYGALDPVTIAEKLGQILIEEGRASEDLEARLARLAEVRRADNAKDLAARTPYFCSGCPHNTSTRVPEGAIAYAGIGCHVMAMWMDRDTNGYTHMGAEGANWIGEGKFSTRSHVFQNLGDGTYNHSGIQAIRAAHAAKANITYKILFNDAVAMTGGQTNDGGLDAARIAWELKGIGLRDIRIVYDEKEEVDFSAFPPDLPRHGRDELMTVQEELQQVRGTTAILYIQTCAAEKRRRRKRGTFPDPDKRVFINTDVCEGCGDCGVQSNCVAIVPAETELGRKRAVDQSACNKDFSCLKGFCPSFVTVSGARPRKAATAEVDLGHLPDPALPAIDGTHNLLITGVGGMGVVTIGATLAMAAHLEGKGVGMMEMAGLAQKGGAVQIHCRIAARPEDITAVRVSVGEAHGVIGGDLVVTGAGKIQGMMAKGRTGAVVNSHEIVTGAFTRDREFRIPGADLQVSLQARLGAEAVVFFDASELAQKVLGDAIFSNMVVTGAAWQRGLIPLGRDAIFQAIKLNGAAPDRNKQAFDLGRWAVLNPEAVAKMLAAEVTARPKSLAEKIDFRADHLRAYQSARLAKKYRRAVEAVTDPDLRAVVAQNYHKLLSYKDEYEVSRLLRDTRAKAEAAFEGELELTYHLAPPLLSRAGPDGRPRKRAFGSWIEKAYGPLAALKLLRGTPLDPFGYTAERRMERELIRLYEADLARVQAEMTPARAEAARALLAWPDMVRGFGPVKAQAVETMRARRAELWAAFEAAEDAVAQAAE
ncbi:putative indolepyruvate oxidoreductase [Dinoroseobacter shibae DFL 12 = DSM 16493]|jgi:indolepyruvate ferredoxin oxidoreductase|uniref:Putative indolepyruvate oxidoreductase n=1 Tax=Dinoroseobacter shibae (strain DSM 16493 / NCIMB 14021 / DFL 12) TaxID=398580 RepID=A8LMF9_DINSH|nr:indolepyruvate ferredoxin oxidoreductase family protein [Dinoroseobacter shibae]ABV93504.1 putative indolepyruvate oxidoreductase [Dinoroseobacter shibae DFL 12 = DSM 16493]URF48415.1 indolepyruvate ferredoxin oxidoreductase family protein [Dinoroseobacter shibae]URF52725.1 indolepyruvate ferredoxin oxidoreductase family protein [Dinoroseobacter shibae]